MTQDFAKKTRSNARKPNHRSSYQSRVPGWVWLFTGTVLGAFVMFLVYLTDIPPQPSEFPGLAIIESDKSVVNVATDPVDQNPLKQPTPKPQFDFYQLLKESEVSKIEGPDAIALPPRQSTQYTLQVGSFRNAADADRLRAELILMNLDARVEKVTVRNAEIWHRVLVGPFPTRAQLAKARGTLAANNFDSLVSQQAATQGEEG